MHVKFKKLAVASAVSAALGMAGTAQAENSLLFPFVTTDANAYTFVSIWQDPSNDTWPAGAPPHAAVTYHMYYGTKATTAAQTAACSHLDFPVQTTRGALLQFEAGTKMNLISDFSDPVGYGSTLNDPNNKLEANQQGFLIVEYQAGLNPATVAEPVADNNMRRIYGEASIVNTATGIALAYKAKDARADTDPNWGLLRNHNGDAYQAQEVAGAVAAGNFLAPAEFTTSWFPRELGGSPLVSSSWYVLPLDTRTSMTPNLGGGVRASIQPGTNWANPGAFGRAESYTSGSSTNRLRCFGTFSVADLFGPTKFATGGWMSFYGNRMGVDIAGNWVSVANGTRVAYTGAGVWASLVYGAQALPALQFPVANYVAANIRTHQPLAVWKLQSTGALGGTVSTLAEVSSRQNNGAAVAAANTGTQQYVINSVAPAAYTATVVE